MGRYLPFSWSGCVPCLSITAVSLWAASPSPPYPKFKFPSHLKRFFSLSASDFRVSDPDINFHDLLLGGDAASQSLHNGSEHFVFYWRRSTNRGCRCMARTETPYFLVPVPVDQQPWSSGRFGSLTVVPQQSFGPPFLLPGSVIIAAQPFSHCRVFVSSTLKLLGWFYFYLCVREAAPQLPFGGVSLTQPRAPFPGPGPQQ